MTEAEITELLFVRDPLARSDLAVVFGHYDPSVSRQRARHAASLFLGGHTPRILFTGGPTGENDRSEAEVMAAVARDAGVPESAILLENRSRTTVENLANSVTLLACQNLLRSLTTAHLVSCPWHMRRVTHLARSAFGSSVRLLASPHEEGCTASNWISSSGCRERVLAELRLIRALLDC